jgi:hypothetical protein
MFSLSTTIASLTLIAVAVAAPLSAAVGPAAPLTECSGCRAGVANWNQAFVVQTLSGQCHVSHNIWRADGRCQATYNDDGTFAACVTDQACGFILDANCAGQCDGVISGMLDATGNLLSMSGCGMQLFTAPYCGWVMPITQFVWSPSTNDLQWATNWLACEFCNGSAPVEPID